MDNHMGQSLLVEIRERGVIRVLSHWGDTSAQYLDPDTGAPAGLVGLVGDMLARDLGVGVEFVDMPWAEQIPALLAGRADISVKHTNTPQRAFEVEFTLLSILCEEGRIVVRRDRGLVGAEALNQPQRSIAVANGASQELHIRERFPKAVMRRYATSDAAFEAVAVGEADAVLHDTRVPVFLRSHPECAVLTGKDGQPVVPYMDCVHPCIRPGDPRFLNWLNNWMAFRRALGTFERLYEEAERDYQAKVDRIEAQAKAAVKA